PTYLSLRCHSLSTGKRSITIQNGTLESTISASLTVHAIVLNTIKRKQKQRKGKEANFVILNSVFPKVGPEKMVWMLRKSSSIFGDKNRFFFPDTIPPYFSSCKMGLKELFHDLLSTDSVKRNIYRCSFELRTVSKQPEKPKAIKELRCWIWFSLLQNPCEVCAFWVPCEKCMGTVTKLFEVKSLAQVLYGTQCGPCSPDKLKTCSI
ncbi:hypothetical protein L345_02160, partial [Ophiophagus hannah]